jgi:ERCC4-type nuclease
LESILLQLRSREYVPAIEEQEFKFYTSLNLYRKARMISVIVDTREQKPLWTGKKCIRKCLVVGDYSTPLLLDTFAIERKSPMDLYGTITKGHPRFRNELIRAEVYNIKLVMYVECPKQKFIDKQFQGGSLRQMESTTLSKIINTVENRYNLEIVWCTSRTNIASKILKRLEYEEQVFKKSQRKNKGSADAKSIRRTKQSKTL